MIIDEYIIHLESIINDSIIVSGYHLQIVKKTDDLGFISGKIDFRDGSALDLKEFVAFSEGMIEKYKYAYNYRKGGHVSFRYDNALDPRARKVSSFAHHKRLDDNEIVGSKKVDLSAVLEEIERVVAGLQ